MIVWTAAERATHRQNAGPQFRCVVGCGREPNGLLLFKRKLEKTIRLPGFGDRLLHLIEYAVVCGTKGCEEAVRSDPDWVWAGPPNAELVSDPDRSWS